MDLKDLKELIALMEKNDLSVFKLEQEGFKITLKRGSESQPVITTIAGPAAPALPAPSAAAEAAAGAAPTAGGTPASNLREITSPMVGTFYAAPSPDSPPYVKAGQEVTEDTVVCIIEAMKVMNEIKAEVRGVITEIIGESGKPVQFGQPLFRVK